MSLIAISSAARLFLAADISQWPPDQQTIERGLPDGAIFAAAYSSTADPQFVVAFFSTRRADGKVDWFARREDASRSGAEQTRWAIASECPALYAALDWLSDIQPPRFAIGGLRRLPDDATPYDIRPRRGPVADGPTYWISGRGWGPDQSLVHFSIMSTGGYVTDWGDSTTRHLQACWQTKVPEF